MPPASEVYIQATDTDPNVQALATVEETHRRVLERLTGLAEGTPSAAPGDRSVDALHRLLHATDQTLYAAASGASETRLLVRALRTASAAITRDARALADDADDAAATAADTAARTTAARSLADVLALHLEVERTVLLPALTELKGVDLPTLVADFGTLAEGGRLEEEAVVDVREIPHGRRHPRIFTRYARLAPGESFTLVNNHDPKPLRREFEATHPGRFTWEYVESGPERWQVRIGRAAEDA